MGDREMIRLEGEWLTASQAAKRLGITTARFFYLVREGRVEYQQLPNGRLYDGESVNRLSVELETSPWRK